MARELASERLTPFVTGFLGYTIAWWILFKRYFMGSWLSTLEHELTHGLFAILTLHRILEIKTSYTLPISSFKFHFAAATQRFCVIKVGMPCRQCCPHLHARLMVRCTLCC